MAADLVIRGADVHTPSGFIPADVVVIDGRVDGLVSRGATVADAETVYGDGCWLTPGFIDLHAHSALRSFDEPQMAAKVSQGFTTQLICPDGLGPAPVDDAHVAARRDYLAGLEPSSLVAWSWRSFDQYLSVLDASAPATDLISCVPHSAIRQVVMGDGDRDATGEELRQMQALTDASLAAGGAAVSFGMIYAPGMYGRGRELRALASVAAKYGVPLVPHVRNEAGESLAAMSEFIDACRETGARLHISHLKLIGNEDLLDQLLGLLEAAATQIDLTVDRYPYGAGSTLLTALLPPWAMAGGPEAALARVRDRAARRELAADMRHGLPGWENLYGSCGAENVTITQATGLDEVVGHTVAEAAEMLKCEPADAVVEICARTSLDAAMIDHYSTERVVHEIYRRSGSLLGSDGVFNPSPHPRLYGSTGRFLGRFAIRGGLASATDAIERMSGRSAALLGLSDRGHIAAGQRADLVLLNPHEFIDTATFTNPCSYTAGVYGVWVAGQQVWTGQASTAARPGRVIRIGKENLA
jgi:N-acyl-D-amino-acid deacylase